MAISTEESHLLNIGITKDSRGLGYGEKLLKKMIKQRSESIEVYKKNNRSDLLEIEQGEVAVLTEYLPKQLNDEETKKICLDIVSSLGASSIKDMGRVMGELKKKYADIVDFAKAGMILKELLNK